MDICTSELILAYFICDGYLIIDFPNNKFYFYIRSMLLASIRKIPAIYVFITLLVVISFIYNYPYILFQRAFSVHQWRQCDCLSIALNYYKEGMHFFSPSVNWCGRNGNGKTSTSECPWLYYAAAILWKIFGYHEYLFRMLDLTILYAGLVAVYKTASGILNNHFLGIFIALFLFTSPLYAYYGNNYLADVPALSYAFIGWYFFYQFYTMQKRVVFIISMLFFMIAGLTKITALISFIPIVFVFLMERLNIYKFNKSGKIFTGTIVPLVAFTLVITPVCLWTAYVIHYNNLNNSGLFSSNALPIWEMSSSKIREIRSNLLFGDLSDLFLHRLCLKFCILFFLFSVVFYRSTSRFLLFLMISVFLGILVYVLLWFQVFDVHDYYLINLLVIVPIILVTFLLALKNKYPHILEMKGVKLFFIILLAYSVYYTGYRTRIRYSTDDGLVKHSPFFNNRFETANLKKMQENYAEHYKALETISPYLRELGIERSDKVISIPDASINISLYFMDQKGFTDFGYNMNDSSVVKKIIALGAKYLILNDTAYLPHTSLLHFINNRIGKYQNIVIYTIK
ncbi:MAG: ArnT family glycosyltransferase [Bacteroidia bacterium]